MSTGMDVEAFCRELGELLTKHKVTIDPCRCGDVLLLREWNGRIGCIVRADENHDEILDIVEE